MTIGQRAYLAILEKAIDESITFVQECDNVEIDLSVPRAWKRGDRNPRADVLQRMALLGYDVIYILTGEKRNNHDDWRTGGNCSEGSR